MVGRASKARDGRPIHSDPTWGPIWKEFWDGAEGYGKHTPTTG